MQSTDLAQRFIQRAKTYLDEKDESKYADALKCINHILEKINKSHPEALSLQQTILNRMAAKQLFTPKNKTKAICSAEETELPNNLAKNPLERAKQLLRQNTNENRYCLEALENIHVLLKCDANHTEALALRSLCYTQIRNTLAALEVSKNFLLLLHWIDIQDKFIFANLEKAILEKNLTKGLLIKFLDKFKEENIQKVDTRLLSFNILSQYKFQMLLQFLDCVSEHHFSAKDYSINLLTQAEECKDLNKKIAFCKEALGYHATLKGYILLIRSMLAQNDLNPEEIRATFNTALSLGNYLAKNISNTECIPPKNKLAQDIELINELNTILKEKIKLDNRLKNEGLFYYQTKMAKAGIKKNEELLQIKKEQLRKLNEEKISSTVTLLPKPAKQKNSMALPSNEHTAEAHINEAKDFIQQNHYKKALQYLKEAKILHSENPDIDYLYQTCLNQLKNDFTENLDHKNICNKIPEEPLLTVSKYIQRARTHLHKKEYKDAANAQMNAILLQPDNIGLYKNLHAALELAKSSSNMPSTEIILNAGTDERIFMATYRQIKNALLPLPLSVDIPKFQPGVKLLFASVQQLARNESEKAMQYLNQAKDCLGDDPFLHALLGICHFLKKDTDAAYKALTDAINNIYYDALPNVMLYYFRFVCRPETDENIADLTRVYFSVLPSVSELNDIQKSWIENYAENLQKKLVPDEKQAPMVYQQFFTEANDCYQKKQYSLAIIAYSKAILCYYKNATAYIQRAKCYLDMQCDREAYHDLLTIQFHVINDSDYETLTEINDLLSRIHHKYNKENTAYYFKFQSTVYQTLKKITEQNLLDKRKRDEIVQDARQPKSAAEEHKKSPSPPSKYSPPQAKVKKLDDIDRLLLRPEKSMTKSSEEPETKTVIAAPPISEIPKQRSPLPYSRLIARFKPVPPMPDLPPSLATSTAPLENIAKPKRLTLADCEKRFILPPLFENFFLHLKTTVITGGFVRDQILSIVSGKEYLPNDVDLKTTEPMEAILHAIQSAWQKLFAIQEKLKYRIPEENKKLIQIQKTDSKLEYDIDITVCTSQDNQIADFTINQLTYNTDKELSDPTQRAFEDLTHQQDKDYQPLIRLLSLDEKLIKSQPFTILRGIKLLNQVHGKMEEKTNQLLRQATPQLTLSTNDVAVSDRHYGFINKCFIKLFCRGNAFANYMSLKDFAIFQYLVNQLQYEKTKNTQDDEFQQSQFKLMDAQFHQENTARTILYIYSLWMVCIVSNNSTLKDHNAITTECWEKTRFAYPLFKCAFDRNLNRKKQPLLNELDALFKTNNSAYSQIKEKNELLRILFNGQTIETASVIDKLSKDLFTEQDEKSLTSFKISLVNLYNTPERTEKATLYDTISNQIVSIYRAKYNSQNLALAQKIVERLLGKSNDQKMIAYQTLLTALSLEHDNIHLQTLREFAPAGQEAKGIYTQLVDTLFRYSPIKKAYALSKMKEHCLKLSDEKYEKDFKRAIRFVLKAREDFAAKKNTSIAPR